jgi:hypothetical protein
MAYNQTRANEYLKVKDTSTGQPEPVEGLNGGIKVTDGTTFITTAQQTAFEPGGANPLGDTSADLGKTYVNYETGQEIEWQGTVRGFIVTGKGGARRVLPDFSVTSAAGKSFSASIDTGTPTAIAKAQILNPSGSGVVVRIKRLYLHPFSTQWYKYGVVSGVTLSTINPDGSAVTGAVNKLGGGGDGGAIAKIEDSAGTTAFPETVVAGMLKIGTGGGDGIDLPFLGEYVIPEGYSFFLYNTTSANGIRAIIEWDEA